MPARARDGWLAAAIALVARVVVVGWAAGRFPASGDGAYYDILARRLAEGHGYTWLWPDGAVTPVAHYPVGYPALIALGYAAFGEHPAVAMGINALFGAALALGVHRLAREGGTRGTAFAGAVLVGLHPALLPYTAAIMTEGVALALVVLAVAFARGSEAPGRWRGWALAGLALGLATLVRPQCLLFAPVLGVLAPRGGDGWGARLRAAACISSLTLAVCAPWTLRNCEVMHRCALVSVNGGWNLLIGAQTTNGAWQEVQPPAACRTVWDEAAKDDCFAREAKIEIARAPGAWLARVPTKLGATFDYLGAAAWYLHLANAGAFPQRAKEALGVVDTLVSRLSLLAALGVVGWAGGPRRIVRIAAVAVGALFACTLHGWIGYLALAGAILAWGPTYLARAPILVAWTAVLILLTAATHAVFFGAGRYGLVVVPFVTALPFLLWRPTCADEAKMRDHSAPTSCRRSPVFDRRREESPSSVECDAR